MTKILDVDKETGQVNETMPVVASAQVGAIAFRSPQEMIDGVTERAKLLADIINKQKLYSTIRNKKYVHVEGWTTMGAMIGVTPAEESVTELEDGGFIATVKLIRIQDGLIIGRGSAECGSDEPTWMGRPKYARRSMAITRATGKAFRLAYSWIMIMAGYAPTPLEEIPPDDDDPKPASEKQIELIRNLQNDTFLDIPDKLQDSINNFVHKDELRTMENASLLINKLKACKKKEAATKPTTEKPLSEFKAEDFAD